MALRRLSAVLFAGLLAAGLVACGDDDDDAAEGTQDTAEEGGSGEAGGEFTPVNEDTLTVVTSLPAPGFWNGNDPAAITGGYEYEIVLALQERLGLGDLQVNERQLRPARGRAGRATSTSRSHR